MPGMVWPWATRIDYHHSDLDHGVHLWRLRRRQRGGERLLVRPHGPGGGALPPSASYKYTCVTERPVVPGIYIAANQ
eukprot:COSAG01_NODE_2227_length_8132_cov_3.231420_4_plen_77_part_00